MRVNDLFNLKESDIASVDSKKDAPDVIKHILIRGGVLLVGLGLIMVFTKLTDGDYFSLLTLIIGAGFTSIWLFFLLIESFVLFSKKRQDTAASNLVMIGIVGFISLTFFR